MIFVPRIHLQSFILGCIVTVALALVAQRTLTVVLAQSTPVLSTSICQDLDINNDDQINVVDFSTMANYFFKSCSQLASAGTATPTPVASPKPPSPTPSAKPPSPTPSPSAKPPSPTPSPVPTTTPGTPTAADPSGEPMPEGDLAGWKQIYKENFTKNLPLGGNYSNERSNPFMTLYSSTFKRVYSDNAPDTAGKTEGKPSVYYPSKVLSVKDGVLIKNVHSETIGGKVKPLAAGLFANVNPADSDGARLYGKFTIRFRVYANNSTSLSGFKMAWLLWPKSQQWPRDGEIDFPEGNFHDVIFAAHHRQGGTSGNDQDLFFSKTKFLDGKWHTASMEWLPNRMTFILDGVKLGEVTQRIPNTPMFWVIQTESCLSIACPNPAANGNVEIDWMTAYAPQ